MFELKKSFNSGSAHFDEFLTEAVEQGSFESFYVPIFTP
jgi:hypothetical protein